MSMLPVAAAPQVPLFGIFFVGSSYPIYTTHFTQVDPTHYVSCCTRAVHLWGGECSVCACTAMHERSARVHSWHQDITTGVVTRGEGCHNVATHSTALLDTFTPS